MPKVKISEFSSTPANNTDIDSINIAEGCAPSGINDAIRELMAQLKDFQTGAVGDSFNGPVGTTTAAAGAFTTLSSTGNTTLGDASGDSVTINGTATFANANPTLSAGTANGVAYLNGSKVVTSGSALTFDGTNLGVGTSSPVANTPLTLQASSGYTDILWLKSVGTNIDTRINIAPTGTGVAQVNNTNGTPIAFQISGNEGMRLTSTGLGIGTSSPTQKLDVAGQVTISSGNGYLWGNGAVQMYSNSSYLRFRTASTDRLEIDSSGNLGLGVTPSAWGSAYKVMDAQSNGGSFGASGYAPFVTCNAYHNGTNWIYKGSSFAPSYYNQFNGSHAWYTAPSGTAGNAITFTQAMTLDASGNLGVGVTSPATRLEVIGASEGEYFRAGGGTISARSLRFSNFTVSGLAGVGHQINVPNADGVLTFATGSTERARIDSSGNLLVGTTSAKSKLVVAGGQISVGTVGSGGAGLYLYINDTLSDNSYLARTSNGSGTTTWYIGNQAITTSSDIRLKDNIKPTERNALALLGQWEIIDHTWNDPSDQCENNRNSRGVWTGISAQQVQQVTPWLVNKPKEDTNEDGSINPWTMDFGYAVPLLVKAIQELKAEFDAYKASHP